MEETIFTAGREHVVSLTHGDVFAYPSDAVALKYAQEFHGADLAAADALWKWPSKQPGHRDLWLPGVGDSAVYPTEGRMKPRHLVLVGVVPIDQFEYAEIRDFSRRAITSVEKLAECQELSLTLHGINYGLDESEAFTAELAGFLDAIRRREWPSHLRKVTIVESDKGRVERLSRVMRQVLPPKVVAQLVEPRYRQTNRLQRLDSAGPGSKHKPHVFVAMPFADEFNDVFHYGINPPIRRAGYLCERIDLQSFTGDVVDRIKERIGRASLVIAEITGANANVYLEVGYAWGRNVRTVLVTRDTEDVRFDLKTQRCLIYRNIQDLEEQLDAELRVLLSPDRS
jgi:hypothetical protein